MARRHVVFSRSGIECLSRTRVDKMYNKDNNLERLAANDRRPRPLQCEDEDAGSRQQTDVVGLLLGPLGDPDGCKRAPSINDDFHLYDFPPKAGQRIHVKPLSCTVWWPQVFAIWAAAWRFKKQANDPSRRRPPIWLFQ